MDRPLVLKTFLVIITVSSVPLRIVIWLSTIGPPPNRHIQRWGVKLWQVLYRFEIIPPILDVLFAGLYVYLFARRFRSTSVENKAFRKTFSLLVAGELLVIAGDAAAMGV